MLPIKLGQAIDQLAKELKEYEKNINNNDLSYLFSHSSRNEGIVKLTLDNSLKAVYLSKELDGNLPEINKVQFNFYLNFGKSKPDPKV